MIIIVRTVYSGIFRDIQQYSVMFRHIVGHEGILRHIRSLLRRKESYFVILGTLCNPCKYNRTISKL